MDWLRVKKSNRCKICDSNSWCSYLEDGSVAKCMRVSEGSFKQQEDGSGLAYYHRLIDKPIQYAPRPKPKIIKDVSNIYRQWEGLELPALSELLGVSVNSLLNVRAGFDGIAWTFPMHDSQRRMVGVRRRFQSGKKVSLTGTHTGLFLPKSDSNRTLLIIEGESDLCAALDLGFDAVGRPSCSAGTEYIKEYLRFKRNVVIVSDNDSPKKRPDGKLFYPGQEGALRLSKAIFLLTKSVTIIKPPKHKDLRSWFNAGCTQKDIINLIKNTKTTYNRG